MEQMLGSYGPQPDGKPYAKNFEPEESPSGMLARSGTYNVRSRVVDDDGEVFAGAFATEIHAESTLRVQQIGNGISSLRKSGLSGHSSGLYIPWILFYAFNCDVGGVFLLVSFLTVHVRITIINHLVVCKDEVGMKDRFIENRKR